MIFWNFTFTCHLNSTFPMIAFGTHLHHKHPQLPSFTIIISTLFKPAPYIHLGLVYCKRNILLPPDSSSSLLFSLCLLYIPVRQNAYPYQSYSVTLRIIVCLVLLTQFPDCQSSSAQIMLLIYSPCALFA